MTLRPLLLALALAGLPGCQIAVYTIGGEGASASGGPCPDGQVACGDGCAPAGQCDDCPEGQVKCGDGCLAAAECDPNTGCPIGQVDCDGTCVAADTCPCTAGCDPEREACEADVCRCRPGLTRCGGACVDTRTDPAHCNGCGLACAADAVCQDSACAGQCAAPNANCSGACVDESNDSLHCGDCGKICAADEVCLSGDCHAYAPIPGCQACPCAEACEGGDSDGGDEMSCCDAPFLGAPVCVLAPCP